MRPATAELLVFEMMRAAIFPTNCFQHLWRERSPIHVIPQIVAGQFAQRYGVRLSLTFARKRSPLSI